MRIPLQPPRVISAYIKGAANIFDFAGVFFPRPVPAHHRLTIEETLRADGLRIAQDMRRAVNRLNAKQVGGMP